MSESTEIMLPVGRIVQGHPMMERTTDQKGEPLVYKRGPKIGQPKSEWYFAVAIAKGQETHWNQTAWGQTIWAVGQAAFPQGQANAGTFAWKVKDGDSQIPDAGGRANCTKEGFAGNWIVALKQGFAPKCHRVGEYAPHQAITDPQEIKCGYYARVLIQVSGNGELQQPGVYVNPALVERSGYGEIISSGPDAQAAFGGAGAPALPTGASAIPLGGMGTSTPQASNVPANTAASQVPGAASGVPGSASQVPGAAAGVPGSAVPGSAGTVAPAEDFLQPQSNIPPAGPTYAMTAKAGGVPYQAFIDQGTWDDQKLLDQGYMVVTG